MGLPSSHFCCAPSLFNAEWHWRPPPYRSGDNLALAKGANAASSCNQACPGAGGGEDAWLSGEHAPCLLTATCCLQGILALSAAGAASTASSRGSKMP